MAGVSDAAYTIVHKTRAWLNNRLDAKWDNDPFGREALGSEDEYRGLWIAAKAREYPAVDAVEAETGFAIDREWLDNLALHTQIVKKKSELAYPHGRLLYAVLRKCIAESGERLVNVLETGTARGFSALCLAKALQDADVEGGVVTLDVLPHLKPQIWNCIDDLERKKSRAELLAPWPELTKRILFLQGDTMQLLPKIGLPHVTFAFLDAQHTRENVLHEVAIIAARQRPGDVLFFDDVTPAMFPGVVQAVDQIEAEGDYAMRRLTLSDQRAYAWGTRRQPL